ncbi:MAG: hypothetical protein A3B44_02450 [Candidatus Levybacteria bacterium RIFCSPLOWO2_01_FULL_38_21]|nr:MAG: hypothetical protein A3B44_02450 [Candidatus Levybacteria bacterium RIFCSPLOWO2_01_FULL_38_21]
MNYPKKASIELINEVQKALDDIVFGSIELYVQNRKVTQITVRHIKKTNVETRKTPDIRTQDEANIKIGIDKQ